MKGLVDRVTATKSNRGRSIWRREIEGSTGKESPSPPSHNNTAAPLHRGMLVASEGPQRYGVILAIRVGDKCWAMFSYGFSSMVKLARTKFMTKETPLDRGSTKTAP
jgi:hypothetical protein